MSPILEEAVSSCQDLAKAAEVIGTADPIDAIRQIECDPEKIRAYAESLGSALTDLDESIHEAEAALDIQKKLEGEGSKSAIAEAKEELDNLKQERTELKNLLEKIRTVAAELEEQLSGAASKIVNTAKSAQQAVEDVLAGLASEESESTVNRAVQEIINIAEQVQNTTGKLCDEFEKAKDSAEDLTSGRKEKGETD